MTETTNQQPTATLHPCGVFTCVVDGVEWRSGDGFWWMSPSGNPSCGGQIHKLRAAAYRVMGASLDASLMGEAMHERPKDLDKSAPDPDGLTPTERAAVTGAIRDAEWGLAVFLLCINRKHYLRMDKITQAANRFANVCERGRVFSFWQRPDECEDFHVLWDTRTGQRTVLDVDAFREAVGVGSEEWDHWLLGEVDRKRKELGHHNAVISSNPDTLFESESFLHITHALNRKTGHWHTRPEPEEETYTGKIDWGFGLYENDLGDQIALCPDDVRLIRGRDGVWQRLVLDEAHLTYRRVSSNPPRVVVEVE